MVPREKLSEIYFDNLTKVPGYMYGGNNRNPSKSTVCWKNRQTIIESKQYFDKCSTIYLHDVKTRKIEWAPNIRNCLNEICDMKILIRSCKKGKLVIMTIYRVSMVVHASSIFGVGIGEIRCRPSIFLGEQFLDFPGVRLNAHREFEIFLRDRIPELHGCEPKPNLVQG